MGKHLKRLDVNRVFNIEKDDDGIFTIWENCYNYFSEEFSGEQLRELAQEIIDLAADANNPAK